MEQQRMEQQRMEQQRMEQQRMEQQRMEEQNRMAGMSQMSEMSQQQSFSRTTTSTQQSSSSQVYESQQFSGGIMKGYKSKDQPPMMNQQMSQMNQQMNQQMSQMMNSHEKQIKDAGIFGGITGDHNSLVEEGDQMDYQKHSVKSLVGHFSKVRPKTEIPVQYLPEQRLYGGEQGPSLNYLTASSETDAHAQSFVRTGAGAGGAKQDIDASRQEYEMRKQKQEQEQQTSQSSTAAVEMRSKTETSAEQRAAVSERRQSLSQALLMDPATEHANAGIIDPSAILRGTNGEDARL